jgi:flagellar basal-body rod modification protein FlgD
LTPNNFIQFLITELQNQDPLDPTSSDEMLTQMSEIGQLQSSTNLDTDLTGMVQQNQVSAAASMIGKSVQGTDQNQNPVSGNVTSVQVNSSGVSLQLDSGSTVALSAVTDISSGSGGSGSSGSSGSSSSTSGSTTQPASGAGTTSP